MKVITPGHNCYKRKFTDASLTDKFIVPIHVKQYNNDKCAAWKNETISSTLLCTPIYVHKRTA